jgi:iron complex transport system ATP-binding protein
MNMICTEEITTRIEGEPILRDVSFCAKEGELVGLIGPNGSGKSTLLRTLSGLLRPASGNLFLDGKPLKQYSSKELARNVGYVPQDTVVDFDFTAREIVLMGRHSYLSRFSSESQHDHMIVHKAMQHTATLHLADRIVTTLSGGQRQMIFIAKALAQEPRLLLLDEPISALDIRYQLHVLELMRMLTQRGMTVVAALHDLNLAARFCDRLVLLMDGEIVGAGTPEEVLTPEMIQRTYKVQAKVRMDPWVGSPTITAISEDFDSSAQDRAITT